VQKWNQSDQGLHIGSVVPIWNARCCPCSIRGQRGSFNVAVGIALYSILFLLLTVSNSFDYNRENGGTSFKARHKNWEMYPMMEDFAVWGAQSFGEGLFRLKENALMYQHFRGLTDQRWCRRVWEEERMPRNKTEEGQGQVPHPSQCQRGGRP